LRSTTLLEAARHLASTDRRHVPLVAALQKTVDMQSQAVFGKLFSSYELLDELRERGFWREHIVMLVQTLREQLPWQYAILSVLRWMAQNDLEGLFGDSSKGCATKAQPLELNARFEDGEFRDQWRHSAERAETFNQLRADPNAVMVATKRMRAEVEPSEGKRQRMVAKAAGERITKRKRPLPEDAH